MNWKFWRANRLNPEQIRLDSIQQQLSEIAKQSLGNAEHLAFITEKMIASNEQIHKWSRFQYKSMQETQSRLDQLEQTLESVSRWQAEQDLKSARIADLEERMDRTSLALIQWLDDIDHLCMKLSEKENDGWLEILQQWADQLLSALETLDIHELDVLNRSFDPRLAESIDTVPAGPAELELSKVPFQVVSVINRGYIRGQNMILRKAQVITLQYDGGESNV
jgi:molecular chaperone GrpE (heat shock protein)